MGVRRLKINKGGALHEYVTKRMHVAGAVSDDERLVNHITLSDPFQWTVMRDKTTYEITWGGNPRGVWCSR